MTQQPRALETLTVCLIPPFSPKLSLLGKAQEANRHLTFTGFHPNTRLSFSAGSKLFPVPHGTQQHNKVHETTLNTGTITAPFHTGNVTAEVEMTVDRREGHHVVSPPKSINRFLVSRLRSVSHEPFWVLASLVLRATSDHTERVKRELESTRDESH